MVDYELASMENFELTKVYQNVLAERVGRAKETRVNLKFLTCLVEAKVGRLVFCSDIIKKKCNCNNCYVYRRQLAICEKDEGKEALK